MKRGRIFLVGSCEGTLMPMDETEFPKEDMLQELLASYPDLLPGDQISPEAPRRWLLVAREMGVPDPSGLGDRWSLDHLYLRGSGYLSTLRLATCQSAHADRVLHWLS
jgi:hypothetical protein